MAERVYLHVGLPKTATTYLQTILWANREVLEEQGVRLPGSLAPGAPLGEPGDP